MASHGVPRSAPVNPTAESEAKIQKYRDLVAEVQKQREAKNYSKDALQLTEKLLFENPEFYTIWNYRREILQNGPFSNTQGDSEDQDSLKNALELLGYELNNILFPLLVKFPKCYWIWNHRFWCLAEFPLTPEQRRTAYLQEKKLAMAMLARDERNFHGWQYRRMILEKTERNLTDELQYADAMLKRSMKNYSAWFERGQILPRQLKERSAKGEERMDILEDELETLHRALVTRPTDQSLWFYYRWVVSSNAVSHWDSLTDHQTIAPYLPKHIRLSMLSSEKEALLGLLQHLQDTAQFEVAGKYVLKMLITLTEFVWQVRGQTETEGHPVEYWEEGSPPEEDDDDEEPVDSAKEFEDVNSWLDSLVELDSKRRNRYLDWKRNLVPVP